MCLDDGFEVPGLIGAVVSVSEALLSNLSRCNFTSGSGTLACENMRVRRCVILGFFGVEVVTAAVVLPLGIEAGLSSGIVGERCVGFASCDCRDDEEIEGEGVGCTERAIGTSSCPFMVGGGRLVLETRVGH